MPIQALVDGMMLGGIYAVVAVSHSMIWATMRTVNIALFQLLAVGGLIGFWVGQYGLLVALVVAALACAVLAVATYFAVMRPLLSKSHITPLIATLGVGAVIQATLAIVAGDQNRLVPTLLPTGNLTIGGIYIGFDGIVTLGIAVAFVVIAVVILGRSGAGLSFRASAWAPELAASYGVRVERVRVVSVLWAGALTGVAGVLIAAMSGTTHPYMGVSVGLLGTIAMLVGGAGSLPGAVIGGLLVGVLEAEVGLFVPGSMAQVITFVLLFIVMIARPRGLLTKGSTS